MKVELTDVTTGERTTLPHLPSLIGRSHHADVRLDDPEVGPYHCMVDREFGGKVVMWDLGTGPSMRVNGQPAMKAILAPGDELTIGKSRFRVQYEAQTASFFAGAIAASAASEK